MERVRACVWACVHVGVCGRPACVRVRVFVCVFTRTCHARACWMQVRASVCTCVGVCVRVRTFVQAYVLARVRASCSVHACVLACVHASTRAHVWIRACTCLPACVLTCMRACAHMRAGGCARMFARSCTRASVRAGWRADMRTSMHAYVDSFVRACVRACMHAQMPAATHARSLFRKLHKMKRLFPSSRLSSWRARRWHRKAAAAYLFSAPHIAYNRIEYPTRPPKFSQEDWRKLSIARMDKISSRDRKRSLDWRMGTIQCMLTCASRAIVLFSDYSGLLRISCSSWCSTSMCWKKEYV